MQFETTEIRSRSAKDCARNA